MGSRNVAPETPERKYSLSEGTFWSLSDLLIPQVRAINYGSKLLQSFAKWPGSLTQLSARERQSQQNRCVPTINGQT
jgi:hypothetical protein